MCLDREKEGEREKERKREREIERGGMLMCPDRDAL